MICKEVVTSLSCHGWTLFDDGTPMVLRADLRESPPSRSASTRSSSDNGSRRTGRTGSDGSHPLGADCAGEPGRCATRSCTACWPRQPAHSPWWKPQFRARAGPAETNSRQAEDPGIAVGAQWVQALVPLASKSRAHTKLRRRARRTPVPQRSGDVDASAYGITWGRARAAVLTLDEHALELAKRPLRPAARRHLVLVGSTSPTPRSVCAGPGQSMRTAPWGP
jgi:hypothetical protein